MSLLSMCPFMMLMLLAEPPEELDGGVQAEAAVVREGEAFTVPLHAGLPSSAARLQPPRLLKEVLAQYPQSAGIGGTVEVVLLVDEKGAVAEARVVGAAQPDLATEALRVAPLFQFSPGMLDGVPVSVWIRYTFRFAPPSQPTAATAVLAGQVRTRGTRRPVSEALVRARDAETVTDADGRFRLELHAGEARVEVLAAGHLPEAFTEILVQGEQREVLYRLTPRDVANYETVVRNEREQVEVSSVSLREQEIREAPGTLGDPFRVVMQLPGVAGLGSGLAYPVVRGSQPATTGTYIDGVRVPLLFHLLLGPSVVHPDFIDGIDFYPGAPPARFGRQLGGIVEGRLRRPRGDGFHATASVDLLSAGAFMELPLPQTGTSVSLAGRFSYSAWLLATAGVFDSRPGWDKPATVAEFGDYQARVEQRLGSWRLRLFAFGASDVAGTRATERGQLVGQLGSLFHRVDARAERPLFDGEMQLGLTWGTERLGLYSDEGSIRRGEFSTGQQTFAARASWQRDISAALSVRLGGDIEHRRAATHIVGASLEVGREPNATDPLRQPSALGMFAGVHAEASWRPSEAWQVTPGLRLDSYHRFGGAQFLTAEPRLAVRYRVGADLTLKTGAGLFHQAPTMLIPLPMVDVAGLAFGLQEGAQFEVGAEWRTPLGLEVSADAYINPLMRSVEFSLEKVLENRRRGDLPPSDPATHGRAYGFELMVRKALGENWFGWVSYSVNRSIRQLRFSRFDDGGVPLEIVSGPATFAFEQAHVLNAAVSLKLPQGFTVGAALHLNTGRPESGELSTRTRRVAGDVGTNWWWVPVERDRVEALPTFVRLDVRAAKDFVFDDFNLQAYLDFFNTTFTPEVYGFSYWGAETGRVNQGVPRRTPLQVPIVLPLLGVKGEY